MLLKYNKNNNYEMKKKRKNSLKSKKSRNKRRSQNHYDFIGMKNDKDSLNRPNTSTPV